MRDKARKWEAGRGQREGGEEEKRLDLRNLITFNIYDYAMCSDRAGVHDTA